MINPKSEILNSKQTQNPKSKTKKLINFEYLDSIFWICLGFIV